MCCKVTLPLTVRTILGSNGNIQLLAEPNGVSYALLSLPKMAPTVSGRGSLLTQRIVALFTLLSTY